VPFAPAEAAPTVSPRNEAAEARLQISIGGLARHRQLATQPLASRYLAWHDQMPRLLSAEGLLDFTRRARVNFAAAKAAGRFHGDVDAFAAGYAQEVRNNYALLLSVAPDMNGKVDPEMIGVDGAAEFRRAAAEGPVVLLSTHISAYHSAAIALSTEAYPIHLVTVKPRGEAFAQRWSHFGALADRYVDPARGNPIPTILVPDLMAPARCLRALRRREPVWLSIDTDVGVANKQDACRFLGHWIALPRAFYELAIREQARFFLMEMTRAGDCFAPATHRFRVTLTPLNRPTSDGLIEFHAQLLRDEEKVLAREPQAWTLWRYWDRDVASSQH